MNAPDQTTAEKWVLFDMDGVVTSEDGYRRATACALMDFAAFLGHEPSRARVFGPEADSLPWQVKPDLRAHAAAQNALINTNWDQCHVAALAMLSSLQQHDSANVDRLSKIDWGSDAPPAEFLNWPPDADPVDAGALLTTAVELAGDLRGFELMESLAIRCAGPVADLAKRRGPIWQWLYRHFQAWFVGTQAADGDGLQTPYFPARKGIVHDEDLLLDTPVLAGTFQALAAAGWKLGIATGRPRDELMPTLQRFGLWSFFQADAITTHDEIAQAEAALAARGMYVHLSKPHPFPFLRSLFPAEGLAALAFQTRLVLPGEVVVVGDTAGDMAAASALGALAVGVLTGPARADAAGALSRAGAKHLLPAVTSLPSLLLSLYP